MEDPSKLLQPIRRSRRVTRAALDAQLESHRAFLAAAAAAATAAFCPDFNHSIRVLEDIKTDRNSFNFERDGFSSSLESPAHKKISRRAMSQHGGSSALDDRKQLVSSISCTSLRPAQHGRRSHNKYFESSPSAVSFSSVLTGTDYDHSLKLEESRMNLYGALRG